MAASAYIVSGIFLFGGLANRLGGSRLTAAFDLRAVTSSLHIIIRRLNNDPGRPVVR